MAQTNTATAQLLPPPAPPRARLFKADYPRTIDRHIDYFGGAAPDPCGERLLDELESDEG